MRKRQEGLGAPLIRLGSGSTDMILIEGRTTMSEPLSKHSALVAEFEAIEDGEAFVAKINEVAPLWPELRGPVADIGARKFEDWHGIVEAWDRAAARSKGLAEQKVIEPAPEEPKPLRRRFTGDAKPAEPELNPALAELLGLKAKPEPIDEEPETEFVEEPEPEPPFEFHPSDFAGAGEAEPVTIEERAKLISELAD